MIGKKAGWLELTASVDVESAPNGAENY